MNRTFDQRRANDARPAMALLAMAALSFMCGASRAAQIDTDSQDLSLRWDNTVKLSTLYRLKDADPALVDSVRLLVPNVPASAFPQALNFNAGDDNFRKQGFVSERVDVLSEFDAVWQHQFGLRVSAAGWYDAAYHRHSDATDPANGQAVVNEFPSRTRRQEGGQAEFLDAFVFGGVDFDDGMKLTGRLGRHALQWGESLFFGDNGIARAQGPIDIDKLLASPNAQFKEIIRPVPQLSTQLQLSSDVSLGAYYQFRWEADRLPAAGSYFSTANTAWGSEQPEFVNIPSGPIAGSYVLSAGGDHSARNSGQFGLQMKWRVAETDVGLYAARYHDKDGQLYGNLNVQTPDASQWYYVFPQGINVFGASASQSLGDFNIAMEGSVRDHMPLRSQNMTYPSAFAPAPQFATGRTAHFNLSTLATFGPTFLSQESSLVAELAWNRVLKTTDPDSELDAGRTRDATALQAIFTPTYRQVLPGLDLDVPVGLRYTLNGNSSVTNWDAKHTGSATFGLAGNYLGVWQLSLGYTHYLGKAVPYIDYSPLLAGGSPIYSHGNPLADRDSVAFSVRRTF